MTRRVVVKAAARRDLLRHASYIADRSPEAALRFLDCSRETFERLARFPSLGSRYRPIVPRLSGLRRFRVRSFADYLVFYRTSEGGIEVIRVIHGARDIGPALSD